jgi:hypothetical protein
MPHKTKVTIVLSPGTALFLMILGLTVSVAWNVGSETMTMVASYPSPMGVYKSIVTTGNSTLGKNAGSAINLAPNGGSISLGSNAAAASLTVTGTLKITGGASNNSILTSSDSQGTAVWRANPNGVNKAYMISAGASTLCLVPNVATGDCSCPSGIANVNYWGNYQSRNLEVIDCI